MIKIENKNKKTIIALLTLSVVLILFALFFPLIIWDALGGGAMHFMQYSRVGVSGDSSGNSAATFFFGIGYTFEHMGPGSFIPAQLFSAQWRAITGVIGMSQAADSLGVITMILMYFVFITPVLMLGLYSLHSFANFAVVKKITKFFSLAMAAIELLIVVWFSIIIFGLLSRIDGTEFRFFDFMAYGGVKFILEALLLAALCALNTVLSIRLFKEERKINAA